MPPLRHDAAVALHQRPQHRSVRIADGTRRGRSSGLGRTIRGQQAAHTGPAHDRHALHARRSQKSDLGRSQPPACGDEDAAARRMGAGLLDLAAHGHRSDDRNRSRRIGRDMLKSDNGIDPLRQRVADLDGARRSRGHRATRGRDPEGQRIVGAGPHGLVRPEREAVGGGADERRQVRRRRHIGSQHPARSLDERHVLRRQRRGPGIGPGGRVADACTAASGGIVRKISTIFERNSSARRLTPIKMPSASPTDAPIATPVIAFRVVYNNPS